LESAVQELPPIYREVYTLRDLEELNIEETANLLGVSGSVVKVRLHRARILLQKALAPFLKNAVPRHKGLLGWFA
jgi:RNA polymerase sigma-70 factor (ECF subfamily)